MVDTLAPAPPLAPPPQATGLALPGSDLDIVVLGVGATLKRAGSGFTHVQVGHSCRLVWSAGLAESVQHWRRCTARLQPGRLAALARCCGCCCRGMRLILYQPCAPPMSACSLRSHSPGLFSVSLPQRKQLSELLEDLLDVLLKV